MNDDAGPELWATEQVWYDHGFWGLYSTLESISYIIRSFLNVRRAGDTLVLLTKSPPDGLRIRVPYYKVRPPWELFGRQDQIRFSTGRWELSGTTKRRRMHSSTFIKNRWKRPKRLGSSE